MIVDERDELIERAARSLAGLPPVNPVAVMHIMSAVRARRAQRPSLVAQFAGWMRVPSLSMASASMLAAATLVIGFVSGGAFNGAASSVARVTGARGAMPLVQVADVPAESRAVAVPMVFDAASAHTVSIVGDFNGWDPTTTPMQRFGADGPWTATVLAKPGRHLYALMVDGVLTVDPRAPKANDKDYGGDASVLMVTKP